MEAFVDISKLSIEEITGTLKSSDDAEEEVAPPPSSSIGKLLLTHEEWLERTKGQDGGRGSSCSGEKKDQKNHHAKSGGGRGEFRDPNKPPASPCFKCHKTGHWARYCPNQPKKKVEAHLAHEPEEDQPMLLMARASVPVEVNARSIASSPASSPPPPATGSLDIKEEKVFTQLRTMCGSRTGGWSLPCVTSD
jgi:hypothetical protein